MFGRGSDARLALEIRGFDLDDANRLARNARNLLESVDGVTDVEVAREEGRPELAVDVDRPKAALLGLSVSDVASTLQTNIAGTQAALFRERGKEYPIIVRLREEDRANVADVNDILVSTPAGDVLQAKNLMNVTLDSGPMQIDRMNQERITTVNAEIETSLSEAVQRIQARLPELNAPADFAVGFGAEVEEQGRAFGQLQLLLLLAVLLVYAVMASQFESLRDPFIIMFAIPLAAIGVIVTLKVTGTSFSMQAYVGVIMLAGIVVNNAILLVDYTNTLRRHAAPADHDDDDDDDSRLGADVARNRRGRRAAGAVGTGRHRRPGDVHPDHIAVRSKPVHPLRRGPLGLEASVSPAGPKRGRVGRRQLTVHRPCRRSPAARRRPAPHMKEFGLG